MASRSKESTFITISIVSALLTTLCSCITDTEYLTFTSISQDGWTKTDTLNYIIPPLEDIESSGISLLLHTEGYPFENIALGITIQQDTNLLYREQRIYDLVQNQPKTGIGNRCNYILPVENISLCDTLPTTITLVQQLNHPFLTGIRKIGVHIGASIRKSGGPSGKQIGNNG